MKKPLASIFSFVVLLFSVAANAGQIASTSASGFKGDDVTLGVTFSAGLNTFSDGGNFRIGFDHAHLALNSITAPSDFDVFNAPDPVNPTVLENLSLTCNTNPPSCNPAVDPGAIFSILFSILASGPDVIPVTIDWYAADDNDYVARLESISPTVTVLARNVPEPGVLGLTGRALLIMTDFGRRGRVNRG